MSNIIKVGFVLLVSSVVVFSKEPVMDYWLNVPYNKWYKVPSNKEFQDKNLSSSLNFMIMTVPFIFHCILKQILLVYLMQKNIEHLNVIYTHLKSN